jgi:hypothetical protein
MAEQELSPYNWLEQEDKNALADRLARLNWLAENAREVNYYLFRGGLISKYLFEETRYCFAYGQFLATIVLGMAFIERTLAALFYMLGRNDLERANMSKLLKEALGQDWITRREYARLEEIRKLRNPITHFRKPRHDDTIEYRATAQDELPYKVIENDAYKVMEIALHLLGVYSV